MIEGCAILSSYAELKYRFSGLWHRDVTNVGPVVGAGRPVPGDTR